MKVAPEVTAIVESRTPSAARPGYAKVATSSWAEIRVVLCGGESLVRAGLRSLIQGRHGVRVVSDVDGATELEAVAGKYQPDVIVFDLNSPDPDDPQLRRSLREVAPSARVLTLAASHGEEWRRRAVLLGAVRLVTRRESPRTFLEAIVEAAAPRPAAASAPPALAVRRFDDPEPLSPRETEVARLVCQGLRNEKIAHVLFISEATVRHHLTSIFAKRRVSSRAELIIDAHRSAFLR